MLGELREQLIGDFDWAPRDSVGVSHCEPFEACESIAVLVVKKGPQVALVDPSLGTERRAKVKAPLAAADHRGTKLCQMLEACRYELGALRASSSAE
jgi:hypothetical protein